VFQRSSLSCGYAHDSPWPGRLGLLLGLGCYSAFTAWRGFAHTPLGYSSPRDVLAGDHVDRFGQTIGTNYEGGVGFVRPLSLAYSRPRRRATWVRRAEMVLGCEIGGIGKLLRGRWRPDLPSQERNVALNSLLTHFRHGAKCLGGGTVRGEEKREGEVVETAVSYFCLELADGSREVVFTDLFFSLTSYAFLRKRDALLVGALRARASEWCRKVGLSKPHTWIAVSSAIHLAWQVSPAEVHASAALAPGRTSRYWWAGA